MANIKGKIRTNDTIAGKIRKNEAIVAKTVAIQAGNLRLADLADVDATGQSDGVMIIFNSTTGKYELKTEIQNENLNIIGGTY